MSGILGNLIRIKDYFDWSKILVCLPSFFLVSFFLTEFTTKLLKIEGFDFYRISGLFKLGFEVFCIFVLLKSKNQPHKFFSVFLFFLICFSLGQIFLKTGLDWNRFLSNTYFLNTYLFGFLIFFSFKQSINLDRSLFEEQFYLVEKTMIVLLLTNLTAIILGLIFNLSFFKTYLGTGRFGFNGFFLHASHSSYIGIINILFFYLAFKTNPKKRNLCLFIASLIMALFIATKTILLFLFLFLLYISFINFNKIKVIIIGLAVLFSLIIFQGFVVNTFKSLFPLLYGVYLEDGFFSMIFSYRNLSFLEGFPNYLSTQWSWLNYFFGGADFHLLRTELELIDLFWFFGIIGATGYIFFFYKVFLKDILASKLMRMPILFLLFCILLAGSFISNAPVAPYFVILIIKFNLVTNKTTFFESI